MSAHKDPLILAIDQGTTSSRTLAISPSGEIISSAQKEFRQIYPQNGWVEHDPEDIWATVLSTLRDVYADVSDKGYHVAAIGITNQRETTLVWERDSGDPIYNAIVWQDRRTAETCRILRDKLSDEKLNAKTGLLHDAYFSSTKAAWILDHVDGARKRAESGELAFGTVDSFLIYRLTGGKSHKTDITNASRTNLYNIYDLAWDSDLLDLFNVPDTVLPDVQDSSADFGTLKTNILGEPLPIFGVAGDQQAATFGQCCFDRGDIKSTYGTGCFVLMNTGDTALSSQNRLLTTIAYGLDGRATYALEGSIFIAGAAVQWLRDEVGLVSDSAETESLAAEDPANNNVYLVPAFTGLGAPYWDPDARGALLGLTRDTNKADIVRATLESVCYQTHDLVRSLSEDGQQPKTLRVDGGMVANSWFVQRLSDIVKIDIDRPMIKETTALGAAYLAGLKAGVYKDLDDIRSRWKCETSFSPHMSAEMREAKLAGWKDAVRRVLA